MDRTTFKQGGKTAHLADLKVGDRVVIRVLRAFEATGLEYVLIGATAMGFHGLVRATEDVDLFIRATPENVERRGVNYFCPSCCLASTSSSFRRRF